MSAPPRPKPRAMPVAAEPFLHAADYEPPVTVEGPEAEPFPLERRAPAAPPTLQSLSEQIGALGGHLQVVHEEAGLTRIAAEGATKAAQAAHAEAQAARGEIAEVRRLVIGDHAPRLTEVTKRVDDVEKRVPLTIPPKVKKVAAHTTVAGAGAGVLALIEWGIPLVQKWIETR